MDGFGRKRFPIGVLVLSAGLAACASGTPWPRNQADLQPAVSTSTIRASLTPDLRVTPPGPEVPEARARMIGFWQGYLCVNATGDVKTAIQSIQGDDVRLVFAIANSRYTIGPHTLRVDGKFVGEEIQGRLTDRSWVHFRSRRDGNLDVLWRAADPNTQPCSGVLTPIPS